MRFYTKSVKSVAQIESVAQIDIQKFGSRVFINLWKPYKKRCRLSYEITNIQKFGSRSGVGYRMKSHRIQWIS